MMYSAVVLSAALVAAVSAVTVNTPSSLVQCQPAQLTWNEGTAPFYVSIIPGGQPSAAALESFPTQNSNAMTWMVDLAAGTQVTVKITDSTGETNYSDQVTIQPGSETSCSNSAAPAGGDASTPAAAPAGGDASASAPAAAGSSSSASAARTPLSSASSAAAAATSKAAGSASSGVQAAAASPSASSSDKPTGAASSVKAGLGMLVGGVVLALAA